MFNILFIDLVIDNLNFIYFPFNPLNYQGKMFDNQKYYFQGGK